MDHKAEADDLFERAVKQTKLITTYDPVTLSHVLLALAHVAAVREQTEVLRHLLAVQERIARQLERRDVMEVVYSDDAAEIDQFLRDGWVIIGGPNDSGVVLLGCPRTLEGGGNADD